MNQSDQTRKKTGSRSNKPTTSNRGFLRWPPIASCHQYPDAIEVYESSIALEGAHLWIAIRGECREHLGSHVQPKGHLSVPAVKGLIQQLQDFVDRAEAGKLTEPAKHKDRCK